LHAAGSDFANENGPLLCAGRAVDPGTN